jgi:hypothetical protein
MGFLSKINKKLGFSKGTKERVRALKRREALGLNPKYVEDPMGPIMSPSGRFNQSALDRLIAETESLNPGMGSILNRPSRVPFDGQINEAALQAIQSPGSKDFRAPRMPNFGMEQMPTARRDPSALERIPMGNMPDFSQIDMSQLDLSGIPQSISQMNLPQMPEGLPSMEEIQGNRRMPQMDRGRMQPRMMMAEGDEVINIIDALQEYGLTVPREVAEQLSRKSGLSLQSINEIINEGGRTISDMDRQMGFKAAGSIGSDDQGNPVFPEYSGGGYVNGYAEGDEVMMALNGGEIESMLSGMDSGEQEAMGELEQMAPEMEMIDQLVMMVVQMIQQGAGEEQVISFLREQGLDDEDIGTVLQLVSEMAETEDASMAAQNEIGADLEQLG